jgi:hypothetical protein
MSLTWQVFGLLLCFLSNTHLEAKDTTKQVQNVPSEEDYSVYDFLGDSKVPVKSILNFKQWSEKDIKYHRKLIVLTYYSRKKCLQCMGRERVMEEVIERYHPQVEFWRYNCDEEFMDDGKDLANTGRFRVDTCRKAYPNQLPYVSFYMPEESVFFPYDPISFQEPQFEPDFSDPNALSQMIESYMPVYAKKIKNMEDANNFIEKFGHLSKVFYFPNSEETPSYFKGLTAVYKDKLEVLLIEEVWTCVQ